MAKYVLSNKAVEDLSGIWNYTIEVWSELQAERYYYLLTDHFQDLADKKILGKKYTEIQEDLYGALIGQHIIFFIKPMAGDIEIVRILHSSMNLKSQLEK